jgi:exodeoxyribonuclease VII large subunit
VRLTAARAATGGLARRFEALARSWTSARRHRVTLSEARLRALGPDAVLARGYGIVRTAQGAVVRSADAVEVGEGLRVVLHRGSLECTVEGRTLE